MLKITEETYLNHIRPHNVMKGVVLVLAVMLAIVSVSASYFPSPDAIFEWKKSNCSENGTITFEVAHEGVTIKFTDIELTIENENGLSVPMVGSWYQRKWLAENYTGSDFSGSTRFVFESIPGIYTTGKYKVRLGWPSTTEYYNNIQFAVECPGIPCSTNNDCNLQQECSNKVCSWLKCGESDYAMGHKCLPKCNDYDSCTTDYLINNKCEFIKKEGCCNKDEDCSAKQVCEDGNCEEKTELNIFQRFWNWLTRSN